MEKFFTQKKERENVKLANDPSWQSGKQWLYASSLLVGLATAGNTLVQSNAVSADDTVPTLVTLFHNLLRFALKWP